MRHDVGGLDAGQIDLSRDQVLDDRGGAAIGHELVLDADLVLEVRGPDLAGTAEADRTEGGALRMLFHPGDQLFQTVRREIVSRHEQHRRRRQQRHRRQVLQQIERKIVDRAGEDVRVQMPDADGVAVRRRARDARHADAAARAGHVLDDDRLAERHLHALGQNAPDGVRRPARAGRRDQRDGTGRIGLRLRAGDRCGDENQCDRRKCFHVTLPRVTFAKPSYSALTPAALMIADHFSISAL